MSNILNRLSDWIDNIGRDLTEEEEKSIELNNAIKKEKLKSISGACVNAQEFIESKDFLRGLRIILKVSKKYNVDYFYNIFKKLGKKQKLSIEEQEDLISFIQDNRVKETSEKLLDKLKKGYIDIKGKIKVDKYLEFNDFLRKIFEKNGFNKIKEIIGEVSGIEELQNSIKDKVGKIIDEETINEKPLIQNPKKNHEKKTSSKQSIINPKEDSKKKTTKEVPIKKPKENDRQETPSKQSIINPKEDNRKKTAREVPIKKPKENDRQKDKEQVEIVPENNDKLILKQEHDEEIENYDEVTDYEILDNPVNLDNIKEIVDLKFNTILLSNNKKLYYKLGFKVDSFGWNVENIFDDPISRQKTNGVIDSIPKEVAVSPSFGGITKGEITEFLGGAYEGEQLFSFNALNEEANNNGARIPSIKELEFILKKEGIGAFIRISPGFRSGKNNRFKLYNKYIHYWTNSLTTEGKRIYLSINTKNGVVRREETDDMNLGFSPCLIKLSNV